MIKKFELRKVNRVFNLWASRVRGDGMAKVYLECGSNGEDEEGAGAFDQLRRALAVVVRQRQIRLQLDLRDERVFKALSQGKTRPQRLSLGYDITALVLVAR